MKIKVAKFLKKLGGIADMVSAVMTILFPNRKKPK